MADSPTEAEAAQAMFCAIADYVGSNNIDTVLNLEKYKTYEDFQGGIYKKQSIQKLIDRVFKFGDPRVKTPGVSQVKIEQFLTKKVGWYESSVLIAKKLIEEIHIIDDDFKKIEGPGWNEFFYVRGASGGITAMDNIAKLFKIANNNSGKIFGDLNKWSPADIYFVSIGARKQIIKEVNDMPIKAKGGTKTNEQVYSMDHLNIFVNGLVDSGDLLPLSLKKASKNTGAHWQKYNFVPGDERKYLESIRFESIRSQGQTGKSAKKAGYPTTPAASSLKSRKQAPSRTATRNLELYFGNGGNLKMRHDPGTSTGFGVSKAVKVEIEQKGAGGRLGSLAGWEREVDIIKSVDDGFGRKVESAFTTAWSNYAREINALNATYKVPLNGTTPFKKVKDLDDALKKALVGKTVKDLDDAIAAANKKTNPKIKKNTPYYHYRGNVYNIKTKTLTSTDNQDVLKCQESTWPISDFHTGTYFVKGWAKKPHQARNLYEEYKIKRIRLSGMYFDNKVYPVIAKYFIENSEPQKYFGQTWTAPNYFTSAIIAGFIQYASGRSPKSGKFVVAK